MLNHKAARMKHKVARAKSRLEDLTFGTFNFCTAAVNGVSGIGYIDTLLRPGAAKGCDFIGLQETKEDVLNKNGKLLLSSAEDNKLALLNTFCCTPKRGVSYTF